jgi:hypothetical protein
VLLSTKINKEKNKEKKEEAEIECVEDAGD